MSRKLIDEVMAIFEPLENGEKGMQMNPAQLGVLLFIADKARHETDPEHEGGKARDAGGTMLKPRQMWCTNEAMCKALGNISDGYRKRIIAGLRDNYGLDVRVPICKDKHGAPLYAVPGRSPIYRVPTKAELQAALDAQLEQRKQHYKG
jgi:hypothetical protein